MAAVAAASCALGCKGDHHDHHHHHHHHDEEEDEHQQPEIKNNAKPNSKSTPTSTLARNGLERDNIGVILNTVAACLLLGGGFVGYMTKGSKASLIVSLMFALCWVFCVHLHVTNTGRNIEQKLIRIRKRSSEIPILAGMYHDAMEDARRTVWRAYAASAISAVALVVLMGLRVVVLQLTVTTPIVATMATGFVVFLLNLQRLIVSA